MMKILQFHCKFHSLFRTEERENWPSECSSEQKSQNVLEQNLGMKSWDEMRYSTTVKKRKRTRILKSRSGLYLDPNLKYRSGLYLNPDFESPGPDCIWTRILKVQVRIVSGSGFWKSRSGFHLDPDCVDRNRIGFECGCCCPRQNLFQTWMNSKGL